MERLDWHNKVVLVTGGGGFIGSHLVERLVSHGARVRAFVRYTSRSQAGFLSNMSPDVLRSAEILHGDLRDCDAVVSATRGVDMVFHLAALIGIPYSYVHPRETIQTNLLGTFNVATAARQEGVERLIHTSSSEVYGTARYAPIDEAHPLQAQSPYSASKIGADKICESFFDSYNLPVVILRPFNTYGPRQSARAVIPTIITQGLAGEEITLGNLSPRRDFTYVADTVDGFLKAAESKDAVGRTINLGTSSEISIGELVEKIGAILGREMQVRPDAQRLRPEGSEVDRLLSDNRLAGVLLGWSPKISLDQGLELTVAWIAKNIHLYRVGHYEI